MDEAGKCISKYSYKWDSNFCMGVELNVVQKNHIRCIHFQLKRIYSTALRRRLSDAFSLYKDHLYSIFNFRSSSGQSFFNSALGIIKANISHNATHTAWCILSLIMKVPNQKRTIVEIILNWIKVSTSVTWYDKQDMRVTHQQYIDYTAIRISQ